MTSRHLPFFSFPLAAFLAALLIAVFAAPARAQSEVGLSSGYTPFSSQPFFILADTQFGSEDNALLRVEVPARDGGREALEAYGGVDVVVYRVPRPLEFLRAQKNLHRVDVRARPRDEGVANTLSYLWDNAWKKSRFAWRDLFSADARRAVTEAAPALLSRPELLRRTEFRAASKFAPLEGFDLVDRFRYPVWQAQPIKPPAGVALAGSSSDFIPSVDGNVHVPLGRLKPGLYLIEAIIGDHRAVTLLFVADTVAVTKIAAGALTVWTAHRTTGQPVAGSRLLWTDGAGTLKSATTDGDGLATLEHTSPERTYLLGEDSAGGVFVSENFYYDSEIHDTKLYAVTDRPLYRPGELVRLKFLARDFEPLGAGRPSRQARAGRLKIAVNDPNGTPVLSTEAELVPDSGADTAFRLPENAVAGGYEIRVGYEDKLYGAAFRVAEYVKPHFEIELVPERKSYKTGEPISGKLKLTYPDGKPVRDAAVELTLRAQTLTMVEGELRYSGLFPVRLSTASLKTDASGEARFTLPAAKTPSRLIVEVMATDGAAYRVRSARELLVERAAASWRLAGDKHFSKVGDAPRFRLEAENETAAPPARWEIVRLEDQSRRDGAFDAAAREWKPTFDRPGSYSLLLRDAEGNIVAAAAHWVSGDGVKVAAGSIEMITDKESYQPGETAEVLISFPEPVEDALLTLERDRVDATALLSKSAAWVRAERLAPNQWRVRIPVREDYAPNMTFSAIYVKNGDYVFQNAGIVVEPPRLALDIRADRETVLPGDMVTVDIAATLRGKPAQAVLTVAVVDEMIYALQPEIAPTLVDFYQHPRRNNVRTSASLNFIAYDEAADYSAAAARKPPPRHQYNERGVKVLERPRRDDTDTAAWLPVLRTDATGHARFTFRMPDALSRWRITVRAVGLADADGVPGQRIAYVRSDKPLYAKWTSPDWLRQGDVPRASLAVFNNTAEERKAEVVLSLGGKVLTQEASLKRGVNYLDFALPAFSGREPARLEIKEGGKLVDALETLIDARPPQWRGPRELLLPVSGSGPVALDLPPDARDLRLRLVGGGAEHFLRIADDLIVYPWGCAEQTASRLIPLALAAPLLAPNRNAESTRGNGGRLWQTLYSQRLRLAALAGPQAVFGWWGDGSDMSALMTAYAYYADWYAARALGLDLPAGHWERVLAAYREHAGREPLLHRALALWFAQEIGLPVRTQAEGLLAALAKAGSTDEDVARGAGWSPFLADPDGALGLAYARTLAAIVAQRAQLSGGTGEDLARAHAALAANGAPSARALLLLAGKEEKASAPAILGTVSSEMPTLDRALTLVWTRKALGELTPGASTARPVGVWQAADGATETAGAVLGQPEWRWPATSPLPHELQLENRAQGAAPLTAVVRFDAEERVGAAGALPVKIERRLYRLTRGDKGYKRTQVKPEEGLSAQELYLDEIVLSSSSVHRYGLVEAALPPGAAIERGTWSIQLDEGGAEATALARSRAEERSGSYGVPVDRLDGTAVVRHLLRVSQGGRFVLPPTRYYRMYQPEEKALADGGASTTWVVK